MHLIDADQFEVISLRAQGGREYANGFDDGVKYVVSKIDKASTIDAIPVGWLIDRATDPERAPLYRRYAQMLYEEWQKEQEAR